MNKYYIYASFAILIWGLEASFLKLSITTLDNFQALFLSLFLAVFTLLIILMLTNKFKNIKKCKLSVFLWFALLGFLCRLLIISFTLCHLIRFLLQKQYCCSIFILVL